MRIVYYAHSIALYGTEQEKRDLATLRNLGFEVVNPNAPEHDAGYKRDGMDHFEKIVKWGSDTLAFRANPDGSINAGVALEIKWALEANHPVIELPANLSRRSLTVEQTRALLREQGWR